MSDTIENLEILIQNAESVLLKIKKYFLRRGLLLNASKTQCIFIGSSQYISRIPNDTVIKCEGEIIKVSQQVKNLGLHMDSYMTFGAHIDWLSRKISGILMCLNRVKDHFDDATRVQIVQTLALSVINYCIKIWGTTSNMYLEKVQKLQNFAARVAIQGIRKYDHITPTLQHLKWLRIKDRYTYEVCVFMFGTLKNKYPHWLYCFPNVGNNRETLTRQNVDLYINRFRTDIGARSIVIRGPSCWNNLPQNVKNSLSVAVFKKNLKNHILSIDC